MLFRFRVFLVIIFFSLCSHCFAEEVAENLPEPQAEVTDLPSPALINMTALPSSIVNGSVNVITGDYMIADVDYSVSAPDPYVLGHSYSSSGLEPGSLGRGWNFHHHHMLEVYQTGEISFRDREAECGDGKMFLYLLEPMGGRIAFSLKCDDDHEIPKLKSFEVITKNTGFTNVLGGEISGQSNIKNIDIDFDRHNNLFTVKLGDGTVRIYERMWTSAEMKKKRPNHVKHYRDYQLHKEILPSGNIYIYHYNDDHQVCSIKCYNRDLSHKLAEVDFEKKGDSIKVNTSDQQEVVYDLKKVKSNSNRGKHTINAIHKPGFPTTHFKYSDSGNSHERRVERLERDDGYFVETKYYRNADNIVGTREVKPEDKEERHFLRNRVRLQKAPVGPGNEEIITHRYFYHKGKGKAGSCTVKDALNNITRYYWNGSRRLIKIEKLTPDRKLLMKETFVWGTGKEQGYLIARNLFDEENKPKLSRVFEYDSRGNVKKELLYGKFCRNGGELKLENGLPHASTCDTLETSYTYSDDDFNLKISECDPLGNYTYYDYHKGTNLLKAKLSCKGKEIKKREFFDYDKNAILIEEIVDDGQSKERDDLKGVTERHIKRMCPRLERPHFGEPEEIKELCLDGKEERLLRQTKHAYDDRGYLCLTKVYDANKKLTSTIEYKHDKWGRLLYKKDALGRQEHYTYDPSGRIETKSGPRDDLLVRYTYDLAGRVTTESEVHKNGPTLTTSYGYDVLGRKVRVIDPQGNATHYEYDALDRVTKITYPTSFDHEGNALTPKKCYTYKKLGTIVVETDEKEHQTTTIYSAAGKVFAKKLADGTKWYYRYNKQGQLFREITPNLAKNYMHYDHFYRLTKVSMHKEGNLLSSKKYSYNTFHLIKEVSPTKEVTLYHYDFAGRKQDVLFGKGKTTKRTQYVYDSLSRLSEERVYVDDKEYIATCNTYDALDRKVSVATKDRHNTMFTHKMFDYDQEGNLCEEVESIMGKMATTKNSFYPHGLVREETDAEGHITKHFYDYFFINVHGQTVIKKMTVDPRGVTEVHILDTRGNLSCVMRYDPFGGLLAKQELYYDAVNNLVRTHDHNIMEGKSEKVVTNMFAYGPLNRLEEITEAFGTPEQKSTRNIYNVLGQKQLVICADGTKLTYTYDDKGRVHEFSAEGNSLHYEYAYDAFDRILWITNRLTGQKTERSYNAFGELVSETLETGVKVAFDNDRAGRIKALMLPDTSNVRFDYSPVFLQKITRLKAADQWQYEIKHRDLSGHILSSELPKMAGTLKYVYDGLGRRIETSHANFSEKAMKFDSAGNLLELMRDEKTDNYTYDYLSQLTSESGSASHAYTYDSLFNRRSIDAQAYTVNALHSVLSDGKENYTYDKRANRLESDNTKYRYDALDRLIEVEKENTRYVYRYDAMDRRIQKETFRKTQDGWKSDDVEKYIYHLQNEIGSIDKNGAIKELRFLGEGLGAEIGATVAIELANKLYVPINDRRGNIAMLLDADTGQVVENYAYDAFGNEMSKRQTTNPWRFSSKRVDPETGLVYFGRRFYDPKLGKWLTHDPMGLKEGPNLYAYVLNNPLTRIDLYGLWDEDDRTIDTSPAINNRETAQDHLSPDARSRDAHDEQNGVQYENISQPFYSATFWDNKDFYYARDEEDDEKSSWRTVVEYGLVALDGVCLASDVYAVYAVLSFNPAGIASGAFAKGISWAGKTVAKLARSQICGRIKTFGTRIQTEHIWTKGKFPSHVKNAFEHWKKHGHEFPEIQNSKQYVEKARELLSSRNPDILTKTRSNGDIIKYNNRTNAMGVYTSKGTPKTMFKPDRSIHNKPTNLDYFNAQ